MRRRPWLVALAALPVVVLAGVAVAEYWPHDPPPPLPPPRRPVLPDLTMPALADLAAAGIEGSDTQQLFFSASIANLGPGPFIVNAVRGDQRSKWRVSQRFRERDGSTTETATPADMVWGGHGHNHWHVRIGATYRLLSLPDLKIVRVLEKVGYCFFDQTRFDLDIPGAPMAGWPRRGRRASPRGSRPAPRLCRGARWPRSPGRNRGARRPAPSPRSAPRAGWSCPAG